MEHIFNIAINIEDERIREVIEKKAVDKIMDDLRKDVEAAIYEHNYSANAYETVDAMIRDRSNRLQPWVKDEFAKILNQNKEEIIDKTTKELAAILAKRKFAIDIAEEAKKNEV